MPIQGRHHIINVGAINQGATSVAFDVSDADSMLLLPVTDAACTIKVDGSDDGGTTWYQFATRYMGQPGGNCFPQPGPIPGLIRFRITTTGTGNVTAMTIDAVKEI